MPNIKSRGFLISKLWGRERESHYYNFGSCKVILLFGEDIVLKCPCSMPGFDALE